MKRAFFVKTFYVYVGEIPIVLELGFSNLLHEHMPLGWSICIFLKQLRVSVGETRTSLLFVVITSLFLTIQETYFFVSVAANPSQAAILPIQWYPEVSKFWIIPKILLTIIALSLIILIMRKPSFLYSFFRQVSLSLDVFRGLREGLERMYQPKATSFMLYRAGKEAGILFAEQVSKETSVKGRALFDQIVKHNLFSRWAEMIEVEDFQIGSQVIISTIGSFESIGRKNSSPLCDFQRGFWAGVCQTLNPNMVCEAEEVLCEARGDPQCKFQVKFFEKAKIKIIEEVEDAGNEFTTGTSKT